MNARKALVTVALLVAFAAACSVAHARLIENWPYDRLFKEADLVVIAEAVSSEDCEDKTRDNLWKAEFLGVNTTFSVKKVLKGKCDGDKITVLHFKLKERILIEDGPLLVSFRTKGVAFEIKNGPKVGLGTPEYMLFLKASEDRRFEPISGRVDPKLSVKELYSPISDLFDETNKK